MYILYVRLKCNWIASCKDCCQVVVDLAPYSIGQGWATGGPGATCGPHLHFMRPSG